MVLFSDFGLDARLLRAVDELGFEAPTPIQAQAIPLLLQGKDVIAQAQTGTGKTAAFVLPLLHRLAPGRNQPQVLIMVPTRELAMQVAEATYSLGKYRPVVVAPVYGGQPIERQFRALRQGVQVVVGTPGRLLDHLRRETLSLERIAMVVLDEADEMLDLGFIEDIELILDQLPSERQTALFSATMPARVAELGRRHLREPVPVTIPAETRTVPQVRQTYYEVVGRDKLDALTRILDQEEPASTILFTRTKREADEVAERLLGRGYPAAALHGDMNQAARERTLGRFKRGQIEILVATDVAARGLDIEAVSHVINYDVPSDPEAYIHRIGRTARAGREGDAITLVTPSERRLLRVIERTINRRIAPVRLPTAADVAARRRLAVRDAIRVVLESDGDLTPYLQLIDDLVASHDPAEIAAAAISLILKESQAARPASDDEPTPAEQRGMVEAGMVRLVLSAGRNDRLRPSDIVGAIANEAGLRGQEIGTIDIYDAYSFVEVPQAAASRVREALAQTTLRGKRVTAKLAKPGRRPGARPTAAAGAGPSTERRRPRD